MHAVPKVKQAEWSVHESMVFLLWLCRLCDGSWFSNGGKYSVTRRFFPAGQPQPSFIATLFGNDDRIMLRISSALFPFVISNEPEKSFPVCNRTCFLTIVIR
jgi:hypothetical protein